MKFDLEERTRCFAIECRKFIRKLNKSIANTEDSKQLVRSSGSVAANYIEANSALSKRDFANRIKICRKEAKESNLWLGLLECDQHLEQERMRLADESMQLTKIFAAIILKSGGYKF